MMALKDVFRADFPMVRWIMMLGKIIRQVITTLIPIDAKLRFCALIAKPIPSHVPSFRASLFDVGMNETSGSRVVCFERCWRLRMPKSCQSPSNNDSGLSIVEDPTRFCFSSGTKYSTESFAIDLHRRVERRQWEG